MDDLISRKALLKSFDVAWMVEYDETGCGVTKKAIPVATIEAAPAIEAEPVVHCRECKHHRAAGCPMRSLHVAPYGYAVNDNTAENGFCHMGAKMDGGADGQTG